MVGLCIPIHEWKRLTNKINHAMGWGTLLFDADEDDDDDGDDGDGDSDGDDGDDDDDGEW